MPIINAPGMSIATAEHAVLATEETNVSYATPLYTQPGLEMNQTISDVEFLTGQKFLNFCMENEMDSSSAEKFSEKQTQTDPIEEQNSSKVRQLETEIKELKCELAKANLAVKAMRTIFTDGQIRKLMSPGGTIKFKWADISSAICLHASGPRAYNHLYKKGFPLPHVSTLQRWCRKIDLREGILKTAIDFMREITDLEPEDKICVLAFDEMKVMEAFEYDEVCDTVKTPTKYVQVVMARGLRKSWKQPVFYNYDCQMTVALLYRIIAELQKVGFPVVAIVCDMGPTNRKLRKELNISLDKPWFPNPTNSTEKIFTFADAPHLLKLIRNHFLDTGLLFNSKIVSPSTIGALLKHTSTGDVSITFKLSEEHIKVKGAGRQKVKTAAQLFSNTTANAIRRCNALGMELHNAVDTANFVQLVNDWFDVQNSGLKTFNYPGKEPFGIALEKQEETLKKMNQLMSAPIVPNRKSLEQFQKGIITSNNALVMLLRYVKERYNMTYICTNRLNQDVLEHFFGAIRSKGGLNDHPTPKEFRYRIRKYILARNTEHLSGRGNVGCDSTEWLHNSSSNNTNTNTFSQQEVHVQSDIQLLTEDDENAQTDDLGDLDASHFHDIGALEEDALEYISGYIIRKLNLQEYQCHENTYTWVDQVSKGYLKKPTPLFLDKIKALEVIFYKINGLEISNRPNLRQRLVQNSELVELPEEIKAFFFKCRIYFRVRHLNKRLKIQKDKQRKMGYSKFLKINF